MSSRYPAAVRRPPVRLLRGPVSPRAAAVRNWLLALLITVWVFPPFIMDVGSGLDPSWGMGLHMAWHRHFRFGRDIIYTFGPLGFLVQPVIAYPAQGLLAGWLRIALFAFAAWFIVGRLQRVMPWWAAAMAGIPLTWAIAAPQGFGGDAPGILLAIALGAAVHRLTTPRASIGGRWTAFLAVACTVCTLIKVDVGIVGGTALVAYSIAAAVSDGSSTRRMLHDVALAVGGQAVSLVLLWILLGQPIGALPEWLRNSVDVALGHNAAMGADSGRPWWAVAVAVALAGVTVLFVVAAWRLPARRRVVATAFAVTVVLLAVKQAFLREDGGHVQRLVAFIVVLSVVLAGRRILPLSVALGGAMVVMAASVNALSATAFLDPGAGARSVRYLVDMTASSSRRSALVAWGHTAQPTVLKVPPTMLERIGRASVHIEPWDASVAWVYGLDWRPLPVFQSYMAYTERLDRINADALASPSGPQAILHQSLALDGRIPRFQSPSANVELLCRYSMVEFGSDWNLFMRDGSSRCGGARRLGRLDARQGRAVTVPASGPDELVVARFADLEPGLPGALRALILRPRPTVFRVGSDPVAHRFIVATAGRPHIIRVPQCLQGRLGSYDTSSYDTFTLSGSRSLPAPVGPRYRVVFEAIAYRCP